MGATAAWLVVMYRFPGRGVFSWALALPLAVPAFALAYGYADLLDVAGPVRRALRAWFGRDLFPFEIRSLAGAAFVLTGAFYPYVYLTARAAFITQSVCALEAARTMGAAPFQVFRRVALPLARPALAAGAALAVMETLADYGAVKFLGVQTLTTGVVRAWSVFGSPADAARLSLLLLVAAAALLWLERRNRLGESYGASSARWRTLAEAPLSGPWKWLATGYCLLLLGLGLVLPAAWLAFKAISVDPDLPQLLRATASPSAWPAPGPRSPWRWRPCSPSAASATTGPSGWPASATPRRARCWRWACWRRRAWSGATWARWARARRRAWCCWSWPMRRG